MDNTFLQNEEDCEQLKVLENGFKIKSYQTKEYNEVSLNTDSDYEYLLNKYYKTFKRSYVLDCTLRDGGYINNWRFNTNFIEKYIEIMNKSTVDIVEIGFLNKSNNYKGVPTGIMRTIDEEYLKLYENSRFKICALADYADINMDLLKKGIKIDLIRIAFHKKDMINALKTCKEIQDLGYNISINAMAVTNYTDEELNILIDLVNENQFFLLYIADSYGSLNQKDLERYLNLFNKKLTKTSVGIHLHNNMNNAFSNYEYASKLIFEKDIYIDTTLFGMGRGAGNLQTELVLHHRQENIKVLMDIFEFINIYIKEYYNLNKNNWGYDLDFLISGIFKIHPNYIDKFREINISFNNLVFLINIILEDKKENYYDNEYINNLIKKNNNRLL
jgi:4-hydroxy 2-oxovalerate aldolase